MTSVLFSALLVCLAPPPQDLVEKTEAVNDKSPEAITALEQAIAAYESKPQEIVADHTISDDIMEARLILAWALFDPSAPISTQDPRVIESIDEVLRAAAVAGRQPSLKGLDPEFVQLVKERAKKLGESTTGKIEVSCDVPCQLIVNEFRTMNPTNPLPLGTYRVWVVANADEIEPMQQMITLDGPTRTLEFAKPLPPPPLPLPGPGPVPAPETKAKSPRKRATITPPPGPDIATPRGSVKPLLPVWAEAFGIVAGAGLAAGGAALLILDGQCKDGGDTNVCPTLIEGTAQGATLASVGSAAVVAFGTLLVIDRVRAPRAGKSRARLEAGRVRF